MRISLRQMAAFQPEADAYFVGRMAEYLTRKYGDTVVDLPGHACLVRELPGPLLTAMVGDGMARARAYGMTWESAICGFVALRFIVGPSFDEHPRVQPVLRDRGVAPDARLDAIADRLSDADWNVVEAAYDPAAWRVTELAERAGVAFPPAGIASDAEEAPTCLDCGAPLSLPQGIPAGTMTACGLCGTGFLVVRGEPLDIDYALAEPLDPQVDELGEDEEDADPEEEDGAVIEEGDELEDIDGEDIDDGHSAFDAGDEPE